MDPNFNIKFFTIVFLLKCSLVHGQWHYPNQYISPLQQQQQTRNQLKRAQLSEESTTTTTKPPPNRPEDVMAASPNIPHYPPSSHAPAPEPRCGESFNCTSSGIFHSPFKPVLENERCVWTVVVPGASGYQIDVLYLGWDPKNNKNGISNQVLINGFKRNGPPTEILM